MYLNSWASLYSDVTFYADPYSANLTLGSASLLAQLYSQSDIRGKACNRMRLVRTLAVEPDRQPYFWATPNAYRTLNMVFLQLLKHKSIQCGLRTFRWSMGFSAGLERCHLPLPSHLTVLKCVASQVEATAVFPSLKKLAVYRMIDINGKWVARQLRCSKLTHLALSGTSTSGNVSMACCFQVENTHLKQLEHLQLEHVHIDMWPFSSETRLSHLSLRFCTEDVGLYQACTASLSHLESFILVSEHELHDVVAFETFLASCEKLKSLALLLAGRTSAIPLSWIRPRYLTLQTLVLEARFSHLTPALEYRYPATDMSKALAEMPHIRVLGVSMDLDVSHALVCTHRARSLQTRLTCNCSTPAFQKAASSYCIYVIGSTLSSLCHVLNGRQRSSPREEIPRSIMPRSFWMTASVIMFQAPPT